MVMRKRNVILITTVLGYCCLERRNVDMPLRNMLARAVRKSRVQVSVDRRLIRSNESIRR